MSARESQGSSPLSLHSLSFRNGKGGFFTLIDFSSLRLLINNGRSGELGFAPFLLYSPPLRNGEGGLLLVKRFLRSSELLRLFEILRQCPLRRDKVYTRSPVQPSSPKWSRRDFAR